MVLRKSMSVVPVQLSRGVVPVLGLIAIACHSGADTRDTATNSSPGGEADGVAFDGRDPEGGIQSTMESTGNPPETRTNAALPWGDWCARTGSDIGMAAQTAVMIALSYWGVQEEDCRTAGLTSDLTFDEGTLWLDYLAGYTYLLMGCPLLGEPVPGGISAFGPANTAARRANISGLGRDDAALLISQYVEPFSLEVQLDAVQRDALEALLWEAAEAEIDPMATATLSTCEGSSTDGP